MNARNGAGPPRSRLGASIPRRGRLLIGGIAALVIVGVLVAPVVILTTGSPNNKCSLNLRYNGVRYSARHVSSKQLVQGVAVGIGETSGCGTKPANIGVRTLLGVRPTVAVGLSADQSSIYVRRGLCAHAVPTALLTCLENA